MYKLNYKYVMLVDFKKIFAHENRRINLLDDVLASSIRGNKMSIAVNKVLVGLGLHVIHHSRH